MRFCTIRKNMLCQQKLYINSMLQLKDTVLPQTFLEEFQFMGTPTGMVLSLVEVMIEYIGVGRDGWQMIEGTKG